MVGIWGGVKTDAVLPIGLNIGGCIIGGGEGIACELSLSLRLPGPTCSISGLLTSGDTAGIPAWKLIGSDDASEEPPVGSIGSKVVVGV